MFFSRSLLLQIFVAVTSTILGIFIGPVLEKFVPSLFDDQNLPYNTFIIIVVIVLISSISISLVNTDTHHQISELTRNTSIITQKMGPRIQIVPYEEASRELQKRTQEANFEILVLSNYKRYDWVKCKPIEFDTSYDTNSERRRNHYASSQAKLQREKNNQFRFVKIVQIPEGCDLNEVFPHDPVYKEDCKFIVELSNADPRFANLRVSEVFFQNTFCVIDRSFLWLEFDIRSFMKKNIQPFVMLVDDKDALVIKGIVELFERIDAVSKRIDSISDADKSR